MKRLRQPEVAEEVATKYPERHRWALGVKCHCHHPPLWEVVIESRNYYALVVPDLPYYLAKKVIVNHNSML